MRFRQATPIEVRLSADLVATLGWPPRPIRREGFGGMFSEPKEGPLCIGEDDHREVDFHFLAIGQKPTVESGSRSTILY